MRPSAQVPALASTRKSQPVRLAIIPLTVSASGAGMMLACHVSAVIHVIIMGLV